MFHLWAFSDDKCSNDRKRQLVLKKRKKTGKKCLMRRQRELHCSAAGPNAVPADGRGRRDYRNMPSPRAKMSRLGTASAKDDDDDDDDDDAPASSAVAQTVATSVAEAARSIRVVLAKGLAGRTSSKSKSSKENDEPSGGAPLLRRFRELQTDREEQDKVIDALRSLLRDKGEQDSRIDQQVDAALFRGIDMKGGGGLPAIAHGASRELLLRELRNLKVRDASRALVAEVFVSCRTPIGAPFIVLVVAARKRKRKRDRRTVVPSRCCIVVVFFSPFEISVHPPLCNNPLTLYLYFTTTTLSLFSSLNVFFFWV